MLKLFILSYSYKVLVETNTSIGECLSFPGSLEVEKWWTHQNFNKESISLYLPTLLLFPSTLNLLLSINTGLAL